MNNLLDLVVCAVIPAWRRQEDHCKLELTWPTKSVSGQDYIVGHVSDKENTRFLGSYGSFGRLVGKVTFPLEPER